MKRAAYLEDETFGSMARNRPPMGHTPPRLKKKRDRTKGERRREHPTPKRAADSRQIAEEKKKGKNR